MSDVADDLSIAIVGMDGRFPGAPDIAAYWRDICAGRSGIERLDDAALDVAGVDRRRRNHPGFVPVAARLADVELFDAEFFGIGAREAQALDPQHRLLLEGARNALESAGYDPRRVDGEVGVFFGVSPSQYLQHHLLPRPDVMASLGDDYVVFGNHASYASTRVAHAFGLRGPVLSLDTACSSSLVAVHLACKALLNFECDMALAGGVQVNPPQQAGYVHQPGAFTAPDGVCRSFDAGAQGTVFGSGMGVVALKRLEGARRDGDTVIAIIRGSAVNNDGADKLGFTAPGVDGQTAVIEKALMFAGVGADTIGYVEAHGTGTPLGDPIEIAALTAAYRADTARSAFCAIGSAKPSIGHLETAAGVAGLIKAALALHHRILPLSLHFERPNPEIDFDSSPFFVNTQTRPWESAGRPRRAAVSSFGIGGTNAHVILEEAPADIDNDEADQLRPTRQLLVWSARDEQALDDATRRLAEHLRAHPGQSLADVAHTLQRGREPFVCRRTLVCRDRADALAALEDPHAAIATGRSPERAPDVVFLFPGQGVQHLGMTGEIHREQRVFRDALDACAESLRPLLDADIRDLLYRRDGRAEAAAAPLDQTRFTQPVLFAVEYALAQQWRAWGVEPAAMLGHSVGEYVAACLAGVFALEDALRLVALRGRLMQDQAPGAMLAVSLPEEELCAIIAGDVDLTAVNVSQACVSPGDATAIAAVEAELARRGVACKRLRAAHAVHSRMMEPALAAFADAVAAVPRRVPALPFVSNLTGDWIADDQAMSVDYWVRHLRGTVRFSAGLECVLRAPGRVLIEVGPGQTLSALARQQRPDNGAVVVPSLAYPDDTRDSDEVLLSALGKTWMAGVAIDWDRLHAGDARRRVPLPTYPYQRRRYWVDPPAPGQPASAPPALPSPGVRPLRDWFHAPVWESVPDLVADAQSASEQWLVFCDASGLGDALAAALRARGERVVEVVAGDAYRAGVDRIAIRTTDPEDYARLFAALGAAGRLPDRIVHAWCVERAGTDHARSQSIGFYSLMHVARALGDTAAPPRRLDVITAGLADVLGDEQLDPAKATVLGPVMALEHEVPQLHCRQIDVVAAPAEGEARAATPVAALLAVLDRAPDASERHLAVRGSRCWRRALRPLPLQAVQPSAPVWVDRGAYLITGGFGALALAFARHLATRCRARLALLGRQPLPPREEWQRLLAERGASVAQLQRIRAVLDLEALGAEVLVLYSDVTDPIAMRSAVEQACSRFGTIDGAMHAAGVAGGDLLRHRRPADAAAVIDPKVRGLQVLLDSFGARRPPLLVLHSSLFAVVGAAGQADYSGANAALDLHAHALHREGVRVLSIDWDGWRETGMAARAGVFARDVPGGIPTRDGMEALERMLAHVRTPQIVVSTLGPDAEAERSPASPAPRPSADAPRHERPSLSTAFAAPQDDTERRLAAIWQDMLGLREVGIYDNFFDLGGTSLLMSETLQRIHREVSDRIAITQLFRFPTIQGLAAHLSGRDEATAGAGPAVDHGNRRREALQAKRRRHAAGPHHTTQGSDRT